MNYVKYSYCTIDVNLAEYQYIADHLNEEECHQLVAALHFRSFQLPKEINSAERRLPNTFSCIDLLLHWNLTPGEGKGQTHVEVCHRLNQIGREDLAKWLSKTVFHEISKDLNSSLNETEELSVSINTTEYFTNEKITDEAAWWNIDSIITVSLVLGAFVLIFVLVILSFLWYSRKYGSKTFNGYKKLTVEES